MLGLDPIRDREEYAALVDLLARQREGTPLVTGARAAAGGGTPAVRRLGSGRPTSGVLGWRVWGPRAPVARRRSCASPTARCTVVDLGSLAHDARSSALVAQAVLSTLWESRLPARALPARRRRGAQHLPGRPADPLTRLSAERAVQIAAEGRKYGLYLLSSTQQPHKVHENVVSQCDNLVLMRMNSQADIADLGRLFSFVPPGADGRATSFRMGQALVAGKIFPQGGYVQMGAGSPRRAAPTSRRPGR